MTARPITVTANALSRIYGNANPALTFVVGGQGLVNGDSLSGSLATTASATSNVGTYAITQGTLAASTNYALSYTGADLTVTARPITVTADSQTKRAGETDPVFTFVVGGDGLVNGDVLSGLLTRDPGESVGSYLIRQGSLSNANYIITFTPGTFRILGRALPPAELSLGVLENARPDGPVSIGPGLLDAGPDLTLTPNTADLAGSDCSTTSAGVCINTGN